MEKYLEEEEKMNKTKIDTDHELKSQSKSVDLNEHPLHVENWRGLSKGEAKNIPDDSECCLIDKDQENIDSIKSPEEVITKTADDSEPSLIVRDDDKENIDFIK